MTDNVKPLPTEGRESLRDQILAAKPPQEVVYVKEWGCDVLVRGMTAREADEYERALAKLDGEDMSRDARTRIAVFCLCDMDGERLFTEDDIDELSQTDGIAISRIADVAMRLNGADEEDVEKN